MKVLISGGCGFIGSHTAEVYIKRSDEVWVIDDLSTGSLENVASTKEDKNFHCIIDTVLNEKIVEEIVKEVDLIYHLAAAVGVKLIIEQPIKTIQTNILGTEIMLRYANKYKKKIFIASSSEVYGKHDKMPLSEEDDRILGPTVKFRWSYSCSKAIDEFLAFAYFKDETLKVTIGRFFNIVGERQSGRYGMVLPKFVKQALQNQPITVYDDGNQVRTFLYVKEAVDAMINLMEVDNAYGEVFNIGSPYPITINELAKKVKEVTKSNSPIIHIPYQQAYQKDFEDMRIRIPDISKIKRYINFNPTVKIEEIIQKVVDYIRPRLTQESV